MLSSRLFENIIQRLVFGRYGTPFAVLTSQMLAGCLSWLAKAFT